MKKSKFYLSILLVSALSYSNVHGTVKSTVSSETQGFFYDDINKKSFNKDLKHTNFNVIDADINFKNVSLGASLNTNEANNLRVKLKSNDINGFNFSYLAKANFKEDRYNGTKNGLLKNEFNVDYKNKYNASFSLDSIYFTPTKTDLNLKAKFKPFDVSYERKQIVGLNEHLIDMINAQRYIAYKDDGHGHGDGKKLKDTDFPEYNINDIMKEYDKKYEFKNVENKIGIFKHFDYKQNEIELMAEYKNKKIYQKLGKEVETEIKGNSVKLEAAISRYLNNNLNVGTKTNFSHENYDTVVYEKPENIKKEGNDKSFVNTRTSAKNLFGSEMYSGINVSKIGVGLNSSYTINPTDKLSILLGFDSNLSLIIKKKKVYEEILEARKKAADLEIEQAKDKQKNMTKEQIAENKEKIKKLEEEIANLNNEKEAFLAKTDFDKTIEESRKDLQRRYVQANENIDSFKNIYKDKTLKEIQADFEEKNQKRQDLENKYDYKNNRIDFINAYNARRTKEENIKKSTELFEKLKAEDPEKLAKEYVELKNYSNGVYSGIKTKIFEDSLTIDRTIKSKTRDLDKHIKLTEPDPMIIGQYEAVLAKTKNNYNLLFEFSPYISASYNFTDRLTGIASLSSTIEFAKDLTNNTKMTNHVHFTPKLQLIYEF